MAAQVTNDILEALLKDLDTLVKATEKAAKTDNASVFSSVGIDPKTVNNQANQAGSFLSIIQNFKSIKKSDVQHMADIMSLMQKTLKGIQLSDNDLKGINNMFKVMGTLNQTFGMMSENIFSTIKKFNPVKGFLLGRMMGKFYRQLFKGFEKEKLTDLVKDLTKLGNKDAEGKSITAFASLTQTLFSVDWKQLLKVGYALKLFPKSAGKNFAGFMHPIIKEIDEMPDNVANLGAGAKGALEWAANPKIAAFIAVINALCSITLKDVIMLKILGTLKPQQGKNIAGFLHNLVSKVNAKDAAKMALLSSMLMFFGLALLAISVAVGIMVAIVALADIGTILLAVGMILVMIGIMWLMIKIFGDIKIKALCKQAQLTLLTLTGVLLGVTLVLAIMTSIVKNNKFTDILLGSLMIIVMLGVMWLMIKVFGNAKMKSQSKGALITLGVLILALLILSFVAMSFVKIGKEAGDVALGALVIVGIILAMAGIIWLLSKISKKTLAAGALTLGVILLATLIIIWVMDLYMDLMQKMNGLDGKDVAINSGIIALILAGVGAAIVGLGVLVFGPQALVFLAGFAALGTIALAIVAISESLSLFCDLLTQVKKVNDNGGVDEALKLILDQLIPAIKDIVSGLLDIGVWSSIKINIIARNLRPLFETLSMFVDVIEKMGSLTMIDYFDEKGKPVYKRMSNEDFKNAATTLTNAFKEFLTTLSTLLEGEVIDKACIVIDKLVGTTSRGGSFLGRLFSREKPKQRPNFKALFEVLSQFVDLIAKFAGGVIEVEWDKDGKCTKRVNLPKVAGPAAKALMGAFKDFLTVLSSLLEGDIIGTAANVIDKLVGTTSTGGNFWGRLFSCEKPKQRPNFKALFEILSAFTDIISKFAGGVVEVEWDAEGKCIKKVNLPKVAGAAAKALVGAFKDFLKSLGSLLEGDVLQHATTVTNMLVPPIQEKRGGILGFLFGEKPPPPKPNFGALFGILSAFTDIISKFASGNVEVEWDKEGKCTKRVQLMKVAPEAAKQLATAFSTFIKSLTSEFSVIGSMCAGFVIEHLTRGDMGKLMAGLSSFADAISKMASSTIADKWDKNGKPIHFRKITDAEFKTAAKTLSTTFTTFLKELADGAANIGWYATLCLKYLAGDDDNPGIKGIIEAVGMFLDPILKIAGGKIDVDGRNVDISGNKLTAAVTNLTGAMITLVKEANKIPKAVSQDDVIRLCQSLLTIQQQIAKIDIKRFETDVNGLKACMGGLLYIVTMLNKINGVASRGTYRSRYMAADSLQRLAYAMNEAAPPAKKLITPLRRVTNDFIRFDTVLIKGNNKRIKAMKNIVKGFDKMTEALNKLNDERERSKELQFGIQEHYIPHVLGLTTAMLSDKIDGILETLYKFPGVGTKSPDQLAQMGDSSTGGGSMDAIRDAIVEGMRAASQEEKILIVKIDGDQAKTLKTTLTSI